MSSAESLSLVRRQRILYLFGSLSEDLFLLAKFINFDLNGAGLGLRLASRTNDENDTYEREEGDKDRERPGEGLIIKRLAC